MAVYEYVAKDGSGRKFSGVYKDIDDAAGLREELSKIGYKLLKARREKIDSVKRIKVKKSEVVTFAYKFSGMYGAGLPLMSCLEALEEQAENPGFKSVIRDMRHGIESGLNLRDACAKHAGVFSRFFLGMIEAGESSGKLATTLEMSAAYLEKREDIRRKVKSAFAYPVIVTAMCLLAIVFLLIFVMPTFEKLYKQVHAQLPGPTKVLIGLSSLVTKQWFTMLLVVAGVIIGVRWLLRQSQVRVYWDAFKLKIPVFARLNRLLMASHFIRTFAMLVSVGVPMIEALDISSTVANNNTLTKVVEELKRMVKAGTPVAQALKSSSFFPPLIIQLAASGEQVGQLPEMLNKGVNLLDKDIDSMISSLLGKMEPILTLSMGIIVGLILIGAYMPMFDYMSHLD